MNQRRRNGLATSENIEIFKVGCRKRQVPTQRFSPLNYLEGWGRLKGEEYKVRRLKKSGRTTN
jgi:hypothetical protein